MSVEKSEISGNSQFIAVNHLYTSGENPDFKVVMKFKDCSFNNSGISTTDPTGSEHALIRWNLPFPTQHFVGQKQYLDAIKQTLQQESHQPIILGIHGMGGVGKTYLVSKIVHDTDDEILKTYRFRAWFPADSQDSLEIAYLKLGEYLGLFSIADTSVSSTTKVAWVLQHLEQRKKCLLVYDNAQSFDNLFPYLPQLSNHFILVTSRVSEWPKFLEMKVMKKMDAKDLVTSLITCKNCNDKDSNASKLIKKLGYLPLAISQASGYIQKQELTIHKYLKLYKGKQRGPLLKATKIFTGENDHQPPFVTWDISIKAIQKEQPKAVSLLIACAYLHTNNIPKTVLSQYLYGNVTDETRFDLEQVLTVLKHYGMIEVFPESISIHRVIQDVIQAQQSDHQEYLKRLIAVFAKIYPFEDKEHSDYQLCGELIQHVKAVFSHYKFYCNHCLNSPDFSLICKILGNFYFSVLSDFRKSHKYYQMSLESYSNLSGRDKKLECVADAHKDLGMSYYGLGKFKESIECYDRSLKIRQKIHGKKPHISTADLWNNLGLSFYALGHIDQAIEYYEKSLKMKLAILKNENARTVARSYHNLGIAYRDSSDLSKRQKAVEFLNKALDIRVALYGEELPSPSVATSYNSLAVTHWKLGKIDQAIKYYQQALNFRIIIYGEFHSVVAISYDNLGTALCSQGKIDEAISHHLEALNIMCHLCGERHPDVAKIYSNLATTHLINGKIDDSIQCHQKALEIAKIFYEEQHPIIQGMLKTLAKVQGMKQNEQPQQDKQDQRENANPAIDHPSGIMIPHCSFFQQESVSDRSPKENVDNGPVTKLDMR